MLIKTVLGNVFFNQLSRYPSLVKEMLPMKMALQYSAARNSYFREVTEWYLSGCLSVKDSF